MIAKMRIARDFLDDFYLPDGYSIMKEQDADKYIIILDIEGPFPSSIPDGSYVYAQLTAHLKPYYFTWQWTVDNVKHGEPIKMKYDLDEL